jgi:hypothetical protein
LRRDGRLLLLAIREETETFAWPGRGEANSKDPDHEPEGGGEIMERSTPRVVVEVVLREPSETADQVGRLELLRADRDHVETVTPEADIRVNGEDLKETRLRRLAELEITAAALYLYADDAERRGDRGAARRARTLGKRHVGEAVELRLDQNETIQSPAPSRSRVGSPRR